MYLQLAENTYLSKKAKKPKVDKNRHPLKKVILAPGRAAMLALLDINADGLATKFAAQDQNQLKSMWQKLGGDYNKLVKNINKGKGKKIKKLNFLDKLAGIKPMSENDITLAENVYLNDYASLSEGEADENPSGLTAATKAKIIGVSTGAATAVGTLVGSPEIGAAGPVLGAVVIGVYPLIHKSANTPDSGTIPPDVREDKSLPPADSETETEDTTNKPIFSNLPKWAIPVGIGAAALIGAYFYFTPKKRSNK